MFEMATALVLEDLESKSVLIFGDILEGVFWKQITARRWLHWLQELLDSGDLSNEKKGPGCFGYIGGYTILPNFVGIITNHYKDPY